MLIRLGIPTSFRRFTAVAAELDAPILISANALTRRHLDYYRAPTYRLLNGRPAALDSAGFVATKKYGGKYIQPREAYVALAGAFPWDWWAQRDFCCEPEIARDRATVLERVRMTVAELAECRREAEEQGVKPPMPVLQGWHPDDYRRCADMMGDLPVLVGVGSVCRRHLNGNDGLISVVDAADQHLPPHVGLHLFGVKGTGITALRGHPRVKGVDSMAWDSAAMAESYDMPRLPNGDKAPCTMQLREEHMRRWYLAQVAQQQAPGWSMQMHLHHGVPA